MKTISFNSFMNRVRLFALRISRFCLSVLLLGAALPLAAQGQSLSDSSLFARHCHIEGSDTLPYLLYRSSKTSSADALPALVVFLHGAGERGNDNCQQLRHCVRFFLDDSVSGRYPFVLLLPQCPENERWVNTDWRLPAHRMEPTPTAQMKGVMAIVDSLKQAHAIDSNRVYISGISMGGFGTWDALQRYPEQFAAAIAVCGGGDPAYASRLKDIPLYIFHGDRDKLVKPDRSQQMYKSLKRLNSKDLHYIRYADLGHLCWDRAFATPGIFQWLFSKQRNGQ